MGTDAKKGLIIILAITLLLGIVTYFLVKLLDDTVSTITSTQHKVDEITRYAEDKESRIEEFQAVDNYVNTLDENLTEIENIAEVLEQLEAIAQDIDVSISIKLEQGTIGEGKIEFEDEKDKEEFLKSLEVEEITNQTEGESDQTQASTTSQSTNAALQAIQESSQEKETLGINYVAVDLTIKGSYEQVRSYIFMLQNSKYLYNVKEIKMSKTDEDLIQGSLQVRAFIFQKDK